PRHSIGPRVRLRAFSGAWAAVSNLIAAHGPEKANARHASSSEKATFETRVRGVLRRRAQRSRRNGSRFAIRRSPNRRQVTEVRRAIRRSKAGRRQPPEEAKLPPSR